MACFRASLSQALPQVGGGVGNGPQGSIEPQDQCAPSYHPFASCLSPELTCLSSVIATVMPACKDPPLGKPLSCTGSSVLWCVTTQVSLSIRKLRLREAISLARATYLCHDIARTGGVQLCLSPYGALNKDIRAIGDRVSQRPQHVRISMAVPQGSPRCPQSLVGQGQLSNQILKPRRLNKTNKKFCFPTF